MTVERKIETPAGGRGSGSGNRKIAAFLNDLEPFFYHRPLIYVDVGAHEADVFAELFRSGLKIQEAHLVEPNPRSFEALARRVEALEAARVATCHHLALADRPGRLSLRDAGTMTKVIGAASEGLETGNKVFEVEARTLDALAEGFTTPHISLLKIDVEGYETEVLAGARGLLEREAIDLIYIEAGLDPEGTQQTYYRAIEDLLRPYRYRLFRIYEQMHEWLEDSPLLRRANFAFMSEAFAARNPYRLSRELMALRKENEGLDRDIAARFAELAKLTELLEAERSAAEQGEARQRKLQTELAAERSARQAAEAGCAEAARKVGEAEALLTREREQAALDQASLARQLREAKTTLRDLRDYGRQLEKRYAAVLKSETWRAMEPVRRVIRMVRGGKAPLPFAPRLAGRAPRRPKAKTPPRKNGAAEVARYVHHLWGGLSRPAVRELSRLMEDAAYDGKSRFLAAHKLATWHAFQGDHEAALAAIRAVERVAPRLRDAKERWMKEGFIHYARGDREAGRAAFAHFLATRPGGYDPDATLALSNAIEDDDLRLAEINKVFERAGFTTIERIDPGRPLDIHNIRGRKVAGGIGDLGRVSVIVPAFNAAHCIGTALAALRAQSYRKLEILVVDDASTDATAEVVAAIAREDPRIRLIRRERNGGAYLARNRGLEEATGAFVTTHDTDDWSHPQKIETQMAYLAAEPRVAGVCAHWVRVRPSLEMSPNWRIGDRILHWNHSSFLFRRTVVDELGAWDPVRVGADTELVWRIQAARGNQAIRSIRKDAPLTFGLDSESSLTRTKETHVRSVYFGLRHIYRAAARHSHAHAPDPGQAAELRLRASPAAHFGKNPLIKLDFLLIGDCTNPVTVEEMRAFIDGPDARGRRIGLSHWPDFDAPPADLCAGYCALLDRDEVEPVPPSARIDLPRRYGIFFGRCHPEIDQFPVLETAGEPPLPQPISLQAPRSSRPAALFPDRGATSTG